MPKPSFQAPTGTRDLYPLELARRRWIESKWRAAAVRHGFDEIDGPTFEHSELYSVKSGEGILNELFQSFSGKDPEQAKKAGEGKAPFALRPEFTPTLARMFAARGAQLPKPTKWFWQGPCFRAERPQRGRLREFWQWNCDILGGVGEKQETAELDAEIIAVCVDLLIACGLKPGDVKVKLSSRHVATEMLIEAGVAEANVPAALQMIDRAGKMPADRHQAECAALGFSMDRYAEIGAGFARLFRAGVTTSGGTTDSDRPSSVDFQPMHALRRHLDQIGIAQWCEFDPGIARGLAYYTGTVFEVIVDGERAVAGGGRYDGLIELFGGPPTPAVGFGMGDVVLSLVLQDKALMPSDEQIARELGLRPDVFVVGNGTPEADAMVPTVLSQLRAQGLHARRSYKSTKNLGKLLKDAADSGARLAMIIEGPAEASAAGAGAGAEKREAGEAGTGAPAVDLRVTLKDLSNGQQETGPLSVLRGRFARA